MSKSNLDVWAIQKYPDELKNALSNIKSDSKNNILYTNCSSTLKLGNISIDKIAFNSFLYAEDSDTLIMLMQNCGADSNDIKRYLDNKKINYHEVVLDNEIEVEYDSNLPELWFAREEYVLRDALEETMDKYYSNSCIYYPNINGELSLNYSTNDDIYELDGRDISGVITTNDKAILLINQNDGRNLKQDDIIRILGQMKFDFEIDKYNIPEFLMTQQKQYKLK